MIRFDCSEMGHRWILNGARPCPRNHYGCSQVVYICFNCEEYDYGEKDGPGYKDCKKRCPYK